jgi:DnaJ-class molecular chaperone
MINAAIMKKQYDKLFAANEKEKKKRQQSKKRIQHSGGITREEAQELIRSRDKATGIQVNNAVQSTTGVSQLRQRAPPTCSNCHTVGHKRTQCPEPTAS